MTTQHAVKTGEHETVIPIRPLSVMDEMERMMENWNPRGWFRSSGRELPFFSENLPQVDVIDCEDEVMIKAAVPGINKEDLEVSLTDHTITIRGCSKTEEKEEKGEYYRHEISTGSFLRTVTLPAAVDDSKVKATFKNGILEVVAPKMESSKRHTIKIS